MKSFGRLLIATATLGLLFCQPVSPQDHTPSTNVHTETPSSASGKTSGSANQDAGWHFALSPYLWFAGAHGTVGALGRDVSIHAGPGDLLSRFDIGVMGAAEPATSAFCCTAICCGSAFPIATQYPPPNWVRFRLMREWANWSGPRTSATAWLTTKN